MAEAMDPLLSLVQQMGATGGALAIAAVPIAVGVAIYLTRMGARSKQDALEGEIARLRDALANESAKLKDELSRLESKYQSLVRTGALTHNQLEQIAVQAGEIADRLDADEFSVLVPAPTAIPGDEPEDLVFLYASGDQKEALRWVRVPIARSIAGDVFRTGQSAIAAPAGAPSAFSGKTDRLTGYKTNEILSAALFSPSMSPTRWKTTPTPRSPPPLNCAPPFARFAIGG